MKLNQSFYQSLDEWIDVSVSEPVSVFEIEDTWYVEALDEDDSGQAEELNFALEL